MGFWLFDYGWRFAAVILGAILIATLVLIFIAWPAESGICIWQVGGQC